MDVALVHLLSTAVRGAGKSAGPYGLMVEIAVHSLCRVPDKRRRGEHTGKTCDLGTIVIPSSAKHSCYPACWLQSFAHVGSIVHRGALRNRGSDWGRMARRRVQTHNGSGSCRDKAVQMHPPLLLGKEAKLLMAKAHLSHLRLKMARGPEQ